jgi:hypothetical protein
MPNKLLAQARVDCRAYVVTSFEETERADRAYWRSRTLEERLAALEFCRQITCGYDPTTRSLSRFFEVTEFPPR